MNVSRHARVLVGAVCALATTATIAAAEPPAHDQQVAVDPNYYAQPTVETVAVDTVPRDSMVVTASAMQGWLSRAPGLERAARGGTVGFSWLQRRGDFPTGVEVTGVFLVGDRMTSYAISSRMLGSPRIGKKLIVPYAAIGIAVGASRVVDLSVAAMSKDATSPAKYGFAIGPSAEFGVHGFLSKKLYWRAGAGFVGAGVGAVTADLGVGFVVD